MKKFPFIADKISVILSTKDSKPVQNLFKTCSKPAPKCFLIFLFLSTKLFCEPNLDCFVSADVNPTDDELIKDIE